MKKIIIIFLALIINIAYLNQLGKPCFAQTEEQKAVEFCENGDKILDYFENKEDKSNPNRYLNAAKYYYYQASRLDLSNPNSLIGHARVALHQQRYRDAKNVLMIALNFNEKNPRVNFYLGETFFADGEYTQAIDYYLVALKNGYKTDFKTNYKLGICYEKLGDIKKSQKHYELSMEIQPNSKEVQNRYDNLQKIENEQNKTQSSTKELEEDISEEDKKILHIPNI